MTFAGVTPSNFEGIKDELTNTVATVLGVDSSAIELSIKISRSRGRNSGTVVVATITSTDSDVANNVKDSINSGSFVSTVNNEVSNSAALMSAGVTLDSATEATAEVLPGMKSLLL